MKYIILESRPDRLGSNITIYIAQILYARHYGYRIHYDLSKLKYTHSDFVKSLLTIIDEYNMQFTEACTEKVSFIQGDWAQQIGGITRLLQSDYISAFKAPSLDLPLPYDPTKSIVIHLRLEDVSKIEEFDGSISSQYYRETMNTDEPLIHKHSNNFPNHQSPLSTATIQARIDILIQKYPDREVVLITNPGAQTSLPYRTLSSQDESYDLFLLSKAEVVILSRSTFAISSLFWGLHKEIHIPLIGFLVLFGFSTKYDKTNCLYF